MTQWKPKQLEWEDAPTTNCSIYAKISFDGKYYVSKIKKGVWVAKFEETFLCQSNDANAVINACQTDFEKRQQVMTEPLLFVDTADNIEKRLEELNCTCCGGSGHKDDAHLEPFWVPIEQCPKHKSVFCFVRNENHVDIGLWQYHQWVDRHGSYIGYEPTHYAEIPPLEAGE